MNYRIAKAGKYELRRKIFADKDHIYTTHDIEIVCYDDVFDCCFTIVSFKENESINSIINLLDSIITEEDLRNIKTLIKIGSFIINETEKNSIL